MHLKSVPNILHKHCFWFLLGRLQYPGGMKNKGYGKFGGTNKVHKEDVQVAHTTFNKYVRVQNFKLTQEFT